MGRRMSRARQNEGEHLMNIYVFFYCRCWLAVAVLQQPNMNARTSTYLKIIIIISINGKVLNTSLHFFFFLHIYFFSFVVCFSFSRGLCHWVNRYSSHCLMLIREKTQQQQQPQIFDVPCAFAYVLGAVRPDHRIKRSILTHSIISAIVSSHVVALLLLLYCPHYYSIFLLRYFRLSFSVRPSVAHHHHHRYAT